MPRVGFELTVPPSARAKTVHDLNRSATVAGNMPLDLFNFDKRLLIAKAAREQFYILRVPLSLLSLFL
jgi:hypothetical protein